MAWLIYKLLFILLRLLTLGVTLVLVRPMAPKLTLSAGLALLGLLGAFGLGMQLAGGWSMLYELNFHLSRAVGTMLSALEFLGYLLLLIGICLMKPAARQA